MNAARPSRYEVSKIYLSRAANWRRNNSPLLSGDSFGDLCDYVAYPPRFRNIAQKYKDLKEARVIFCPSDKLEQFFYEFSGIIQAKVVIAGNSDHEFHDRPINIPRSVKALYLQNSFVSDDSFIFTLPIGLENLKLGMNGKPRNFKNLDSMSAKLPKVLFGPFSNTHPDRVKVHDLFSCSGEWHDFLDYRLPPKNFVNLVRSYSYVASVRGNGVDTHRLWESLYLGTVPIVARDSWSESLLKLNLPIMLIDHWTLENIEAVIKNEIVEIFDPKQCPALWIDFWSSKLKSHF
jgi:hypothetical protein